MKKGKIIEIVITDAAYEGNGIGRYEGQVVFVKNTAPGDLAEVEITRVKKSFIEASLVRVIKPAECRVLPKCSHAIYCGGCTWQHVKYQKQLDFKQKIVRDHLHRIGGLTSLEPKPVIGCYQEYNYRNKMEFTFSDRRWLTPEEISTGEPIRNDEVALGLHIPGRYDKILNLKECHLQAGLSYKILDFTRHYAIQNNLSTYNSKNRSGYLRNLMIRTAVNNNECMVNLVTFSDLPEIMHHYTVQLLSEFPQVTTIVNNVNDTLSPTSTGRYEKIYHGNGSIKEIIGDYIFEIDANTFFQTNTAQALKLFELVKEFASVNKADVIYDLYCGVGSISLFMSKNAKKVIGIEINQTSVEKAKKNSELNHVNNTFFETGDMRDALSTDLINKYGVPDVLITDPPRAGMHESVLNKLMDLNLKRIIYVSCNSATLARDLAFLSGKYKIDNVQPVDMFPQTYHIESVTLLTLL